MERITVKQAAALVGVEEQSMRQMINHGLLGRVIKRKTRNTYYITDEMVKEFMKGGTQ
jgi:hypothetical protein